ncbi:MAG: hypothetical protein LH605_10040 [Microbacteriaceae bacterium]|nr:hypothetical protein [Microbacteriaceae bacterium]
MGDQNVESNLSFLPVALVGIPFGLAMDYQLCPGCGMREASVHGASARLAVARGFRVDHPRAHTPAGHVGVRRFAGGR